MKEAQVILNRLLDKFENSKSDKGCSGKKDRTEWKRAEEPGTFYGLSASVLLSGLLLGI